MDFVGSFFVPNKHCTQHYTQQPVKKLPLDLSGGVNMSRGHHDRLRMISECKWIHNPAPIVLLTHVN